MWLIESYGKVTEVNGHLRCDKAWRDKVLEEMASGPENRGGFEKNCMLKFGSKAPRARRPLFQLKSCMRLGLCV